MNKRELGKKGEEFAIKFLEKSGIKIIFHNYFTKYGEIDLIGLENKTIIFIEVKFRNNINFGYPIESIDSKKIEKIKNAANDFIIKMNYKDYDFRFDVISLLNNEKNGRINVNWLKNQFF